MYVPYQTLYKSDSLCQVLDKGSDLGNFSCMMSTPQLKQWIESLLDAFTMS